MTLEKLTDYLQQSLPYAASFGVKILISLLAFYLGRKVIRYLVKFLRNSLERTRVDTGVVQFLCSLARLLLYAVLIFGIAKNFGVTEASVAALLGSAGITIGLGLQGGLANLAGGVMILVFKPFAVGDYIIEHATACEGSVVKIEMCYTTLSTIDNQRIVIPNGTLSGNSISNVTAQEKRRLEVKVGISYASDVKKAKEILRGLLEEDEDVLSQEELLVFVDALSESAVILGFRAWVPTGRFFSAKWRINERILEEFSREGIAIPYPQMEIHLKK